MKTTDLINALIFALEDEEITKQLDAALIGSNISLTGFKIEKLLELYKKGALKGQRSNVYTDMVRFDEYLKVAETSIVEQAAYVAEKYSEGWPLAILKAVTGLIEDDLQEHVAEYEQARWG